MDGQPFAAQAGLQQIFRQVFDLKYLPADIDDQQSLVICIHA